MYKYPNITTLKNNPPTNFQNAPQDWYIAPYISTSKHFHLLPPYLHTYKYTHYFMIVYDYHIIALHHDSHHIRIFKIEAKSYVFWDILLRSFW